MKVVERMIQEIYPGKNIELEALDKRYDAVEGPLGFPPKRRLWCISGPHHSSVLILEREWESMAAMEAAYEKTIDNSDLAALWEEGQNIVKNSSRELYVLA